MNKYYLAIPFLLGFALSLYSNTTPNPLEAGIRLCSGETITWEEYLERRACMEASETLEVSEFIPFKVNVVNNVDGAWSSVIDMPLVSAAAAQLPNGKIFVLVGKR